MAEDIGDLEARVRARTATKPSTCSTCDWIGNQPDAEVWDRLMALPRQQAGHFAIHDEMVARGYPQGRKAVEDHRKKGHRRG